LSNFTDDINPAELRITGSVQQVTQTVTNGITGSPSWANLEASVRSMELNPLKYINSEGIEGAQITHVEKRSFLYRAHSRVFTPKMRYVVSSKNYYITDIRNYKGRPHWKVMDCELRDNE
jgi:hypothetical protein